MIQAKILYTCQSFCKVFCINYPFNLHIEELCSESTDWETEANRIRFVTLSMLQICLATEQDLEPRKITDVGIMPLVRWCLPATESS
jgi:hypothetical protein